MDIPNTQERALFHKQLLEETRISKEGKLQLYKALRSMAQISGGF